MGVNSNHNIFIVQLFFRCNKIGRCKVRKVRNIIITIVVILAIVFGLALYIFMNIIPSNDPNVTGNTSGNLFNGGWFCEYDGTVYFRNNYNNGCMYSMKPDETGITRLTDMHVDYISAAGKYLYFHMDSNKKSDQTEGLGSAVHLFGVYRSKLNGSSQDCLYRGYTAAQNLVGNYVYFQEQKDPKGILNRVRIDESDMSMVSVDFIDPSCTDDKGRIYFTGVESDHNLYCMDTLNSNAIRKIADGSIYFPIYHKGWIYYVDAVNNYLITRLNPDTGGKQILSEHRADCFNMNDNYIFYANSSEEKPAIHVMSLDGANDVPVIEGVYNHINVTSRYVYFSAYNDEKRMWHMPVNGSASPSLFNPVESR